MVPGPEEEFANFLDFGDLQLDFSPFDGVAPDGRGAQQDADVVMDTAMDNGPEMVDFGMGHNLHQPEQTTPHPSTNGYTSSAEHVFQMQSVGEHYRPDRHAQMNMKLPRQYPPGMVPPTPNSLELQGGVPGYYQASMHTQAHAYEHYQRSQGDNVIMYSGRFASPLLMS